MFVLSETIALAAYPGKVILSDFKTVHGNVVLNTESCIKLSNELLKVWIKIFKLFLMNEPFEIIEIKTQTDNFQISKLENNLSLTCKNYSYILSKNDVCLLMSEYPKMYILSLCLPPEICLVQNCLLEKIEEKVLQHYKAFNNFEYNLTEFLSNEFLNTIKEIILLFELSVSPYFVYTILSSYKKNYKYLVQARTVMDFVNASLPETNAAESTE